MNGAFQEAILLVDDEADIRDVIAASLASLGIPVLQAADGPEALEVVKKHAIFLMITDYRMPGMNGIQLVEAVRAEKPGVVCVILSGFADRDVVLGSLRAGVNDVMEKPGDITRASEVARKYLEKRIQELRAEQEEMASLRLVFLAEARELFADIDNWILRLEGESLDPMVVDTVFRKAHTLKGSAGAFPGAEVLGKVVHAYENVLTKVRNRSMGASAGLVDLLLRGSDVIRGLIEDFGEGRPPRLDPGGIVAEFQKAAETNGASLGGEPSPTGPAVVPEGGGKPPERRPEAAEDDSILVSNETLVEFMELSGELIVFKNTHGAFLRQLLAIPGAGAYGQVMEDFSHTLEKLSERFQRQIMEIRKVTLEHAFAKFPRMIRQISKDLGKKMVLRMEGIDLGVDKSIAKALAASLVHVIRNAADHGIESPEKRVAAGKPESGTILLTCLQSGDFIQVRVEDDGAGINSEKVLAKAIGNGLVTQEQARFLSPEDIVELLFLPGFSTAEKVTSVSGRGVGMDVVRSEIAKFQGTVKMQSELGRGTTLSISIPVPKTVMVENSVLARSGDTLFAIPLTCIDAISSLGETTVTNVQGMLACQHKGRTIPIGHYHEYLGRAGLHDLVGEPPPRDESSQDLVVVLNHRNDFLGLRVDSIVEQQEAVIRPFDDIIEIIPGFKGTSILSNEQVAFVVSAEEMVELVRRGNSGGDAAK